MTTGRPRLRVVVLTRAGKASGVALAHTLQKHGVLAGVIAEPPWRLFQHQFGRRLFTRLGRPGAGMFLSRAAVCWMTQAGSRRAAARAGRQLAANGLPDDRWRVVPDLNGPESLALLASWRPHVLLVANAPLLRPAVFNACEYTAINFHSGRLPEYGGVASAFWALHDGADAAWVTFHQVEARLDSGAILAEAPVPVRPGDTPTRLQARALAAAQALLPALLDRLADGTPPALREPGPARLRPWPTLRHYLAWRRRAYKTRR